jgi:3',5'-cyclic AMP phosphodiesterase CpdA
MAEPLPRRKVASCHFEILQDGITLPVEGQGQDWPERETIVRIVHLSDIHIWRYTFHPVHLWSKRALGMLSLVVRRARRFRLERLQEVVERVRSLEPDHILITGDLTTTALPSEFRAAREALADLLIDPGRVTIIPGNHDRYTILAMRDRHFETWFGAFMPSSTYPWLRPLDRDTAILGLDPTRAHLSARGHLPAEQLARARDLLADPAARPRRLLVACHYPVAVHPGHARELWSKRLANAGPLLDWLAEIGPHLYCCGHVHTAWAYRPPDLPGHLSLNAGAPLLRDRTGRRPPGFLEIVLHNQDVTVDHHAWTGSEWVVRPLYQDPAFFPQYIDTNDLRQT